MPAWYNASWLYRKKLTAPAATGGGGALTGVPLYFDASADSDIVVSMRLDAKDLLFTKADGTTKIPHELLPSGQFFTKNGSTTWFGGPRALYHNGTHERLFISFVQGVVGTGHAGVTQYDYGNGALVETIINTNPSGEDDHIQPALLVRSSDSKLLAVYPATHNGSMKFRISTNAEDATAWGSEQTMGTESPDECAYPFLAQFSGGRIYCFYRVQAVSPWKYSYSDDGGATWAGGGDVVVLSTGGWDSRPYGVMYWNGVDDRIDFLFSTGDPLLSSVKIYHFYFDGTWRNSAGTGTTLPVTTSNASLVYDGTGNSDQVWVGDVCFPHGGNPRCLWYVYDAGTITSQDLWYGAWNGSSWDTEKVMREGAGLPDYTNSYPGISVLEPTAATTIWAAVQVGGAGGFYQIQKWDKSGGSWAKTVDGDITSGTPNINFRPYVARGCPAGKRGRVIFQSVQKYAGYGDFNGGFTAYPALGSHARRVYIKADITGAGTTDLYCYYGNPTCANQEDAASVWSAYQYVYHGQQHYGVAPNYYTDSAGIGNTLKVADGGEDVSSTVGASLNTATFRTSNPSSLNSAGTPPTASKTAFSTEAWFKATAGSDGTDALLAQGGIEQITSFVRRVSGTWTSYDFIRINGDTAEGGDAATVVPVVNTWTYKVQSWTAAGGIKVRLNKVEGSVASTTGTTLSASAAAALTLGFYNDSGQDFRGLLAEFRVRLDVGLTKPQTDTQYDNWVSGNGFFTIGVQETQGPLVQSGTDSGTGTETPLILIATADTGTGSETGLASILFVATDSGVGSEVGSIAVAATETGAGSDMGALAAVLAGADTGLGVDLPGIIITGIDAGSAVENAIVIQATDTGVRYPRSATVRGSGGQTVTLLAGEP